MSKLTKRLLSALLVAGLLLNPERAFADPVGDFFKRLGRSMSKKNKGQPRHSSSKSSSKQSTKDPSASPTPANGTTGVMSSPTSRFNPSVRTATAAAPELKGKKRDVPYGIPVPGRQGFVTSPYLPDGNYVDVRAFDPGTEVKDPYSGKIFRVP